MRPFSCSPASGKPVTSWSNKKFVVSNVLAKNKEFVGESEVQKCAHPILKIHAAPRYKTDPRQYCCPQSAPSGHYKCTTNSTTCDRTVHVLFGFPTSIPFAVVKFARQIRTHNPQLHIKCQHEVCGEQAFFNAFTSSESIPFFWLSCVPSCFHPAQHQSDTTCMPVGSPNSFVCIISFVATAIRCKPDVDFASLASGKMLNMVCFHVSGTFQLKDSSETIHMERSPASLQNP